MGLDSSDDGFGSSALPVDLHPQPDSEASTISIKFKNIKIFETHLFREVIKEYFQTVFPKIFESYALTPAKGGTHFEKYSDMNYPMHILNGILPAMLYLEQRFIDNPEIARLILSEDPDIKMLVKCAILGITFHDLNKLVGKRDLVESLKDFENVLNTLKLDLTDEEKSIIKYLIVGTENYTRYTISDAGLPKRRNIERVVKDYLLEAVHLADSVSIPPENSLSYTFMYIQKKLKNYFQEVHTFYFHDTPYEVLSRYLLIKIMSKVKGRVLLISPRGFVWIGESLEMDYFKSILNEIENDYEALLLDNLDSFIAIDWQKAQLDIFRYITPTKDFVKERLIPVLLERKKEMILYRGLGELRESVEREIEKLEVDDRLDVVLILKLILTLTAANTLVKKLKKEKEKEYYPEIKEKNPVLRNVRKIIDAAFKFDGDLNKLYDDLVELLIENYKDETIDIKEVMETVLSYAYLDGKPIFEIKLEEIGDKQNICSICGAKADIVAKEGVAFGFKPRGFTNRAVVSTKNMERKICKTCLAEIMLRKLIFSRSGEQYAVYIDACDYTTPILNAGRLVENIEEQINGLRRLSTDILNSYRVIYGIPFKDSKNVMIPFLMAYMKTGKESDFLRRYYELLVFASNTGFKIYLTYALNPDRTRKETFVLDYAPKSIKMLRWDKIRIDKLKCVRDEFEILMNLAKGVGGRKWQNEFIRILNDYASFPLSFFYYLYRLDKPFDFINKNQDKVYLIYERIGGEIMGVIEKLADIASDIEPSRYTTSKQTWIIRTAIDALKTGVQRNLDEADIVALMAGMIYKKVKYPNKEKIEDFCNAVYKDLYEDTWKNKIPSKTELKYWIYAFAFEYVKKTEEKREKKNEEKQKRR